MSIKELLINSYKDRCVNSNLKADPGSFLAKKPVRFVLRLHVQNDFIHKNSCWKPNDKNVFITP